MFQKLLALIKKHKDILLYLIFGVLTTLVNYGVYLPLYHYAGASAAVSNTLAWAAAVIFAFLCAAGGTWLFGVRLGWLAVGAYMGMALDECVRAVFMFLRWRSGHWRKTGLVKANS